MFGKSRDPMENIVLMYGCPIKPWQPSPYVPEQPIQVDPIPVPEVGKELERLRNDLMTKALAEAQDLLLKYYPVGTTVEVTKDYFKVNLPA